jgi:ankyrin repeat protein
MKKIVHTLCFIASVYSASLGGMELIVLTQSHTPQLSKEIIKQIVPYCCSKEKNTLKMVCKDFYACLKSRPVTINQKVRHLFMYTYLNDIEMMQMLLENERLENYTNILGMTPFHVASDNDNVAAMQLLVDHGADVNKLKPQIHALHEAVYKGEVKTVKSLLRVGVKPDLVLANGLTPLGIAAFEGCVSIVELLLKAEIKANVHHQNSDGFTPLHIAVHNGHTEIVKLLLGAQANVYQVDIHGCTALTIATYKSNIDSIPLLINAGADVNHKVKKGWSPLCIAAYNGDSNVVQLLLDNGANIHCAIKVKLVKDPLIKKGDTPLQIAQKKGHADVVHVLEKALQCETKNDRAIKKNRSKEKTENCIVQ